MNTQVLKSAAAQANDAIERLEYLLLQPENKKHWPEIAEVYWRFLRFDNLGVHFFLQGSQYVGESETLKLYIPYFLKNDYSQKGEERSLVWDFDNNELFQWVARSLGDSDTSHSVIGVDLWRYLISEIPKIAGIAS